MSKKCEDWMRTSDAALYYYKQTGDKVPTQQTIRNWMRVGRCGYHGDIVKLQSKAKGRVAMTTKAWLDEFIGELSNERVQTIIRRCDSRTTAARIPPPPSGN